MAGPAEALAIADFRFADVGIENSISGFGMLCFLCLCVYVYVNAYACAYVYAYAYVDVDVYAYIIR